MRVYVCVYVCREAAWMGEGVWERGVGDKDCIHVPMLCGHTFTCP